MNNARRATKLGERLPLTIGTLTSAAVLLAATAGSASAAGGTGEDDAAASAKNVIIFLGDGMAAAQRNAGRLTQEGLEGDLVMDTLPFTGAVQTHPEDPETFVTDSAASATAYATGVKTYNGAISVDVDGNPVETLMQRAEAEGKATGVVTTSQVTDASGAAFAANVADRGEQTEIARQYIEETGLDVILGGGEDYWYPGVEGEVSDEQGAFPDQPAEDPEEGSLSDQGNLVERATEEFGYEYVTGPEELAAAEGDKLLGLFANQEMFQANREGEGDVYDPVVSLEDMTAKALETLAGDDDGFVLVVEEEAIDEMGAANNSPQTINGVLELDKAVALGKDFAEEDGDTLVITVGDHEVGGMVIEATEDEDESGDPGTSPSVEDGPYPIADSDLTFTVDWTTGSHSNVDVPLTAMGPGAEDLVGVYENTAVNGVINKALFGDD